MESKMKVLPTLVLGGALVFSITAGSAEEFNWQRCDPREKASRRGG